jgi:hypothetical protein
VFEKNEENMDSLIKGFPELLKIIAFSGTKAEYLNILLLCKASYAAINCDEAHKKFIHFSKKRYYSMRTADEPDTFVVKYFDGKGQIVERKIYSTNELIYDCKYVDGVAQDRLLSEECVYRSRGLMIYSKEIDEKRKITVAYDYNGISQIDFMRDIHDNLSTEKEICIGRMYPGNLESSNLRQKLSLSYFRSQVSKTGLEAL